MILFFFFEIVKKVHKKGVQIVPTNKEMRKKENLMQNGNFSDDNKVFSYLIHFNTYKVLHRNYRASSDSIIHISFQSFCFSGTYTYK